MRQNERRHYLLSSLLRAAEIAVRSVKEYREKTESKMEVIFNVFRDDDYEIYEKLLGKN